MEKSLQSMVDNAFLHAGQYGTKLRNLVSENLNYREKNGENITISDVTYAISKMQEGYNIILDIASRSKNPGNVIASAMNVIGNQVSTSGIVDAFENVAENVAMEALEQEEAREGISEDLSGIQEAVIAAAIVYTPEEKVEKLFGAEIINKINSNYEAASKGDIDSIAKVNEIERITDLSVAHEELDDKAKRGLLARMMRLSTLETEESNQVLSDLADKYGIDIFRVDDAGKKVVDYGKLEQAYHDAVEPVNPKAAQKTREDFAKLVATSAKREADKGTFADKDRTLQGAVADRAKNRELIKFEREMNRAYKENDTDTMRKLMEQDPDKARDMVRDLLRWQENPRLAQEKQIMLQQEAMEISEFLHEKEKEQKREEMDPQISARFEQVTERQDGKLNQEKNEEGPER